MTVNGGKIKANWGIESNTADNLFQTITISGSGKNNHDTCFKVEKGYDSHFGGNVTIDIGGMTVNGVNNPAELAVEYYYMKFSLLKAAWSA